MRRIDSETLLCGVIGNPVAHSLSPDLHNAGYEALGLNFVYLAFRVEDVGGCLAGMRAMENLRGLSVTIPHKQSVMEHLDQVDPAALRAGSVNTVTREGDKLTGSTTDGPGALRAFREAGVELDGKHMLFIGSGGAVRAVAFAFGEQAAVSSITILGRTPARVSGLVDNLRAECDLAIHGADLATDLVECVERADILVQGTPIGMQGGDEGESPVPVQALRGEHVVFDMVYRPRVTRLLADAAGKGCTTITGDDMLLYQAALQFERWTGQPAPVAPMRAALLSRLED